MTGLVHYENVIGQLRIYEPGQAPPGPYSGSGMVVWRDSTNCEIRGLHAKMTRQQWRDVAATLRKRGATTLWAKRGPGKLLPFAQPGADGWQRIDLADIKEYDTGHAPLV